jgi:uncharacterized protein (TIGR03790 family)
MCTAFVVVLLALAPKASAQSSENVAVVVNDRSEASTRIGAYYVEKRGIPSDNVIRISAAPDESISRADYLAAIQEPIQRALVQKLLHDRILYIVLTKGVPLRIKGDGGPSGTVSSVDSELTLLYRRKSGLPAPIIGHVPNPYFLGDRPIAGAERFSHRAHDIYLVTRLDGFTVDEVIALIDRAQAPARSGRIVLDQRSGLHSDNTGDRWLAEAAARLGSATALLEPTTNPARDVDDVLGYYSWGSNDAANRSRRFGMRFVNGALAATFVSTDGRSLQPPPDDWNPSGNWNDRARLYAGSPQTLIGDLIREGATGVAAHVAEPYLGSTIRPQILFPAYLSGKNLAESFYLAMPHLSWQTIVIGDPLCSPFGGQILSRSDLEDPVDPATELPGLFARRRMNQLRQGFKGTPDPVLALLARAERSLQQEDTPGARTFLEQAVEKAPDLWTVQLQLATLAEQAGDHDVAAARYREVLRVQPNQYVALNNLAFSLATRKKAYEEAFPLAKRAVAMAPQLASTRDTLGWIEYLRGNHAEAVASLTEAVRLAPANAEIRLHLAVASAAAGDLTAARQHLQRAVALDPAIDKTPESQDLRKRLDKQLHP